MLRRGCRFVSLEPPGMTRVLLALLLALPLLADSPTPIETRVLELTNRERLQAGLPALKSEMKLVQAGRLHSREMCELNYFSHASPTSGQETPRQRVESVGARSMAIGENIYMSSGRSPEEVPARALTSWMNSPGHRANILSPDFTSLGIGIFVSGPKVYVTQVFSADLE
ncbi:hypothetical protein DYH09_26775 [bacterium CPR1]|nr:hypothetical protein [bacterium CPR1]